MGSWHSYGSIYNLGHRAVIDLLKSPVLVEEKIDGSQFNFGVIDGELRCRSKGAELNIVAPDKMFQKAVETVQSLQDNLIPGWTYRGEYLAKPKHNALVYDRVPQQNVILFDIATDEETYVRYETLAAEAARLGFDVVPRLYEGLVENIDMFRDLLDTPSTLGGQKVEGVVVKNYALFGPDKKTLMGKFVSEAFKEVHAKSWGEANPSTGDFIQRLAETYRTPARWQKAVQHMRERGEITDSTKDIGLLIREAQTDIVKEEADAIREALYKQFSSQIMRTATRGLPEWYKEQLLALQFTRTEATDLATAAA